MGLAMGTLCFAHPAQRLGSQGQWLQLPDVSIEGLQPVPKQCFGTSLFTVDEPSLEIVFMRLNE